MFDDAQAEAGSAFPRGSVPCRPIETFEKVGQVAAGMPGPLSGLRLRPPHPSGAPGRRRAIRAGVFQRVIQEVLANLGDFERIDEHQARSPGRPPNEISDASCARVERPRTSSTKLVRRSASTVDSPVQPGIDRLQT